MKPPRSLTLILLVALLLAVRFPLPSAHLFRVSYAFFLSDPPPNSKPPQTHSPLPSPSPAPLPSLSASRPSPPNRPPHYGGAAGDRSGSKRSELNVGKKVGLSFLGVIVLLQVVLGVFLLYKRRQIWKVGVRLERFPSSSSPHRRSSPD